MVCAGVLWLCRSGFGLGTQNLVAFLGSNGCADQVKENATRGTASAAIGQHQATVVLGLHGLIKEGLGAFRSQDTQGALEVFAGDGLGFSELGGEFIGGEGRVL